MVPLFLFIVVSLHFDFPPAQFAILFHRLSLPPDVDHTPLLPGGQAIKHVWLPVFFPAILTRKVLFVTDWK